MKDRIRPKKSMAKVSLKTLAEVRDRTKNDPQMLLRLMRSAMDLELYDAEPTYAMAPLETVLWSIIRADVIAYRTAYDDRVEKAKKNGRKGAEKRWGKKRAKRRKSKDVVIKDPTLSPYENDMLYNPFFNPDDWTDPLTKERDAQLRAKEKAEREKEWEKEKNDFPAVPREECPF